MPAQPTLTLTPAEIADDVTARIGELLFAFRDGLTTSLRDELAQVGATGDSSLAFILDRGRQALAELRDDLRELDAAPSVVQHTWVADEALRRARQLLLRDAA